uniref:Late embryogenesis abundant protein n=1 Tax=Glycine max TaxID=3847 RepID=C6T102_SOYBN|nr:unknown [Glycine max]
MAANSSSRGITALGKRVANRIWTSNAPPLTSRRGAYSSGSVYDKNPDDEIQSGQVPDDVIQAATQSGKYWAPHPQTGVFGPPGGGDQTAFAIHFDALEEKAWFRPTSLEDFEKPHTLP